MNPDDRERLDNEDPGVFDLTDQELETLLCGGSPWTVFDSGNP